jgi:hypothetical protein
MPRSSHPLRSAAVAIAAIVGIPFAAAANPPLANPSFEVVGPNGPVTVNSTAAPGGAGLSAAESWGVFHNTAPATTTTELVPTTLPLASAGVRMLHVVADRASNGIVGVTGPFGSGPVSAVASGWVLVNSGVVGMGSGNGGQTTLDVLSTTTGVWEYLQAPNGFSPVNEMIFYASGGPADFYVELADLTEIQEIGLSRVEYSNLPDEQAVPGGGDHGAPDPGQVLYTEPIDLPTDSNPRDVVDFYPGIESGEEPDAQVDALANGADAGLLEVLSDSAGLLVSLAGDPGATQPIAAYEERIDGTTSEAFSHRDFNAVDVFGDIDDVDALELWGEGASDDDPSDADYFSLEGDVGAVSVWSHISGTPLPYIQQANIGAAVIQLGFNGSADEADLDALMVLDVAPHGVWGEGDEILFSIRAANNWDGGELVHLRFGAFPHFLEHGGHDWDTTFGVAGAFLGAVGIGEEVDAIELPEPDALAGLLCGGLCLIALERRRVRALRG